MPDDFNTIATDAANAVKRRLGPCPIGIRPLHNQGRDWSLAFGQQPLHPPYADLVNAIAERIQAEGGEPIAIAADDTRTAWAMLLRLPFLCDVKPVREAFYRLLATCTVETPDQIARLARGPGESAVLDAQDVFSSLAARVGAVTRSLAAIDAADKAQ